MDKQSIRIGSEMRFESGIFNQRHVRCPLSVVRREQKAKDSGQRTTDHGRRTFFNGFTQIELMAVTTLILILAHIAVPSFQQAVQQERDAVPRDDL